MTLPAPLLASVGAVIAGWLAEIRFTNTITIGSIIVAAIVVIAGGIFSFRNNLKGFYKDGYHERGEQIAALQLQIHTKDQEWAKFGEEQKVVRHELKGQIATLQARLELLETRTDVSAQLQPLIKWTQDHEARDQERFDATALVQKNTAAVLEELVSSVQAIAAAVTP